MSGNNIDNTEQEISQQAERAAKVSQQVVLNKGKQVIGGAAKKMFSKAAMNALKGAGAAAIKSSLLYVLGAIAVPVLLVLSVIFLLYVVLPASKTYSPLVSQNVIGSETIKGFDITEEEMAESSNGRSTQSSDSDSINGNIVSQDTKIQSIILNEENQAIENYHYYKAKESMLNNKAYIGVKNIDIKKEGAELIKELESKGVLKVEGNERFINEDSLSEVESKWKKEYGGEGISFKWTDEKLKKDLDKRINTGITVEGFDEKYIEDLKFITDEEEKLTIKDEYEREEYFQLPEELLGALNTNVYAGEFIYDDPFVQGVKFTYKKKKEAGKKEESVVKINKKAANNNYTAEMFDKHFKDKLKGTGKYFIEYANKYDVDAGLMVAISCLESGYGTSDIAKKYNNVFGMLKPGRVPYKFSTVEEGIEKGISNLSRNYISQGLTELEDIGKKYCRETYKDWVSKVANLYEKITGVPYSGKGVGKGFGSNVTEYRGVPDYEIKLDSYGIKNNRITSKYGLGTVFLYKPTITIEIKRGVEVNQVLKTTGESKKVIQTKEYPYKEGESLEPQKQQTQNKDGETVNILVEYKVVEKEVDGKKVKKKIATVSEITKIYTPQVEATPIEEVTAKVSYVLDKAITFAGVYEFEYGLVAEETGGESSVNEREVKGAVDANGKAVKEVSMTETKTIKIYEKPLNVVCGDLSTNYMDSYLANFRAYVPNHIAKNFRINKMVDAFKGSKESISSSSGGVVDYENGGEDFDRVNAMRDKAEKYGEEYGIDPNILLAMVYNESKGDHHIDQNKKASNDAYIGLAQMGGPPQDHDIYSYFSSDEINLSQDYSIDDRVPHCPSGSHNEAEHERVENLHFEYLAKRITNQMAQFISKQYGKDVSKNPKSVTKEEIQTALFYSFCAYNTGAGGQNGILKWAGYDTNKLYGSNGKEYIRVFNEYKSTKKGPVGTATYLEKGYDDYRMFSGKGEISQSAELYEYDPSKWFIVGKLPTQSINSSSTITVSSNGTKMDIDKVEAYIEYEKNNKENEDVQMGTIVNKITAEGAEVIRRTAIGMIEGESALDVKVTDNVFWSNGYASNYFEDGLQCRPLYGNELSEQTWSKKIRESSTFTGGVEGILDLARTYGKEVYAIVKRAVEIEGGVYEVGRAGPYSFDHAGMLWYVFNSNSNVDYFGKGSIEEQYNKLNITVEPNDIRPGDIIFYSMKDEESDTPTRIGIYLGNRAYLFINELEKEVQIGDYESLESNDNVDIKDIRRVIKFDGDTSSPDLNGVGTLPADFASGDWVDPIGDVSIPVYMTSPLGYRNCPTHGWEFHTGVDYGIPVGTPLRAASSGTVTFAGGVRNDKSYGLYVVIEHEGYITLYAHMDSISVKTGQTVSMGEFIGKSGNTGSSTGPHLHYEIIVGNKRPGVKEEYPKGSYVDANKYLKYPSK